MLSHFPRRRLDAEQIRDTILTVSGKLDLTVGGPNIGGAGAIDANTTAAQNTEYGYVFADTRRSVYTPAFRARRLELFEVFDFGNINQPIGERNTSTVAPQALFLLNHEFTWKLAREIAGRLTRESHPDDRSRVRRAYALLFSRAPAGEELAIAERVLGPTGRREPLAAWTDLVHVLLSTNEFVYLD